MLARTARVKTESFPPATISSRCVIQAKRRVPTTSGRHATSKRRKLACSAQPMLNQLPHFLAGGGTCRDEIGYPIKTVPGRVPIFGPSGRKPARCRVAHQNPAKFDLARGDRQAALWIARPDPVNNQLCARTKYAGPSFCGKRSAGPGYYAATGLRLPERHYRDALFVNFSLDRESLFSSVLWLSTAAVKLREASAMRDLVRMRAHIAW